MPGDIQRIQAADALKITQGNKVKHIAAGQHTTIWLCHSITGYVPADLRQKFEEIVNKLSKPSSSESNQSEISDHKKLSGNFYIKCLELPKLGDLPRDAITLDGLASYHIKCIKETQSDGPYYLAGWSFGGKLAALIAQKLQAQQDEVVFLGIIDSAAKDISQLSIEEQISEYKSIIEGVAKGYKVKIIYPQNFQSDNSSWLEQFAEAVEYSIPSKKFTQNLTEFISISENINYLFGLNLLSIRPIVNANVTVEFKSSSLDQQTESFTLNPSSFHDQQEESFTLNPIYINASHNNIYLTEIFAAELIRYLSIVVKEVARNRIASELSDHLGISFEKALQSINSLESGSSESDDEDTPTANRLPIRRGNDYGPRIFNGESTGSRNTASVGKSQRLTRSNSLSALTGKKGVYESLCRVSEDFLRTISKSY